MANTRTQVEATRIADRKAAKMMAFDIFTGDVKRCGVAGKSSGNIRLNSIVLTEAEMFAVTRLMESQGTDDPQEVLRDLVRATPEYGGIELADD